MYQFKASSKRNTQLFINRDKSARNMFPNSAPMKEMCKTHGTLKLAAAGKELKGSIKMIGKVVLQSAANCNHTLQTLWERRCCPLHMGK